MKPEGVTIYMTKRYEFSKQDGFTNKKIGRRLIPEIGWGNYLYDRAVWIPKTGGFIYKKKVTD